MIDELRATIRAKSRSDFDFTTVGDVPFTPFTKPLASSRIALVSTAGLYLDDQEPFDRANPNGDCTFRRIRATDDLTRLRIDWESPASQDINCAFPITLLRDMCEPAPTHYSFSGSIPDPGPLLEETAPQVARELEADAAVIAPS